MNDNLVNLAIVEYQREFNRKDSLDAKAIGYITFASLIVSASISLYTVVFSINTNILIKYLTLALLFLELYFSSAAIIFAFRSHKMCESASFKIDGIINMWDKSEDEINGSILQTIQAILKENIEINSKIEKDNDLVYSFIRISIFCFIILAIVCLLIFLGGKHG